MAENRDIEGGIQHRQNIETEAQLLPDTKGDIRHLPRLERQGRLHTLSAGQGVVTSTRAAAENISQDGRTGREVGGQRVGNPITVENRDHVARRVVRKPNPYWEFCRIQCLGQWSQFPRNFAISFLL